MNYVDCGIYLLQYIESFLIDPDYCLSIQNEKSLNKLRLFPRSLVNRKRSMLQKLIVGAGIDKQDATNQYLEKRNEILEEAENNEDEYDVIDMKLYEEHLLENNLQKNH